MTGYLRDYWQKRLQACAKALEKNNFAVLLADDPAQARELILKKVVAPLNPATAGWGDSMSLMATGVMDDLRAAPGVEFIDSFEPGLSQEEKVRRHRRALVADLFLTGSNAVTMDGKLVNLDKMGNRVAALIFGPRRVVVVVGRNKLVPDVAAAMARIKDYAAPLNAARHDFATPCAAAGRCLDCAAPQRICNAWGIMEKSFPPGKITVVLVNRDLGL